MSKLPNMPRCVAIVICNDVIEDKRSSNKTLVGLFNQIMVQHLPTKHQRFFLFLCLAEFAGRAELTIGINSPSRELLRLSGAINSTDYNATADLVVELQGLPLEEPGRHRIDVQVDGVSIADRSFIVSLAPPTGTHPGPTGVIGGA